MRTSSAPEFKVGFECGQAAGIKRSTVWQDPELRIERFFGSVERTFTTFAEVPPESGIVAISESGAVLIRGESAARWYLCPPFGVSICKGPRRVILRVGKGLHSSLLITWRLDSASALARIVDELSNGSSNLHNGLGFPTRAVAPHFEAGWARMNRGLESTNHAVGGALIRSAIAEAVAFVGDDGSESMLAPTPHGLPDTLQALIESVRATPSKPWPLKDASDEAGYSPFHFSRTFKLLVGYGFHEFVDRTRTEAAVELLCSTSEPVDVVAAAAGYGTTQGLRDSIKEYLGLVPTELRTDPDEKLLS